MRVQEHSGPTSQARLTVCNTQNQFLKQPQSQTRHGLGDRRKFAVTDSDGAVLDKLLHNSALSQRLVVRELASSEALCMSC